MSIPQAVRTLPSLLRRKRSPALDSLATKYCRPSLSTSHLPSGGCGPLSLGSAGTVLGAASALAAGLAFFGGAARVGRAPPASTAAASSSAGVTRRHGDLRIDFNTRKLLSGIPSATPRPSKNRTSS